MLANYLIGNGILYGTRKAINSSTLKLMANEEKQIAELKDLINEELKDCNHLLWPHVCRMQSTEHGLEKLQSMIINLIAHDGMEIGSAIALVEQELTHIL